MTELSRQLVAHPRGFRLAELPRILPKLVASDRRLRFYVVGDGKCRKTRSRISDFSQFAAKRVARPESTKAWQSAETPHGLAPLAQRLDQSDPAHPPQPIVGAGAAVRGQRC